MALETLKGIKKIGNFKVLQERPLRSDGTVDWDKFDELRKDSPIYVDNEVNTISFRIQNGSIKESGVNGCQVDTVIEAAKLSIEGLNANYPCRENAMAITKLDEALMWLEKRTKDRELRNVEGTNQK